MAVPTSARSSRPTPRTAACGVRTSTRRVAAGASGPADLPALAR